MRIRLRVSGLSSSRFRRMKMEILLDLPTACSGPDVERSLQSPAIVVREAKKFIDIAEGMRFKQKS